MFYFRKFRELSFSFRLFAFCIAISSLPEFPKSFYAGNFHAGNFHAGTVYAQDPGSIFGPHLDILTPQPSGQSFLARFYRENADSVVYITGINVQPEEKSTDEFFTPPEGTKDENTVGTGFILHESGYAVTNAHAVTRTLLPEVELKDGTSCPAEVAALIPSEDLALLRFTPPKALSAVKIEPDPTLAVGDTIVTIGCPHGLKYTLGYGIISAQNRSTVVTDIPGLVLRGLLQTDAPINPGSSGGPWFNLSGNVVGMTVSKRGDSDNISFGISLETIHYQFPKMLHRAVRQQWELPFQAEGNRKPVRHHARIGQIDASAAEKLGLKQGDVILSVNGTEILNPIDLYLALLECKTGDEVVLTVAPEAAELAWSAKFLDKGEGKNLIKLPAALFERTFSELHHSQSTAGTESSEALPYPAEVRECRFRLEPRRTPEMFPLTEDRLFMKVRAITPEEQKKFNLRVPKAVMIQEVDQEKYGKLKHAPRPGDLLARVNFERPDSPEKLEEILENTSENANFQIVILRRSEVDGKAELTRIDINNWKP